MRPSQKKLPAYSERRWLRGGEKLLARLEDMVNRLTGGENGDFNPLYHLGTLAVFLLILLTITGAYLTVFYRPGSDQAYRTVEEISSNWLGLLMRGMHRYASDGLIAVILLHTLKMLFGERFWGARWLGWISGWVMLVLTWGLGSMGYWLVWDQRAQWMTESLLMASKGAIALTFVAADLASKTFSTFIIALFLHVFLPLGLLLGIVIHVMRLARARWWSPRWLMVQSTVALFILALIFPARSAAVADLGLAVPQVRLDLFYLGFLPIAEAIGQAPFWLASLALLVVAIAIPWLWHGRDDGPADISNPGCTGCVLCARECPYNAIEMDARDDDTRYKKLAAINPALCTGCGICVGTCATAGVSLVNLPTGLLINPLFGALELAAQTGRKTTVIFSCQRHITLGSLPKRLAAGSQADTSPAALMTLPLAGAVSVQKPLIQASWGSNGKVLVCSVPCVGMVDVDWIKELHSRGASDIILHSCPFDDCNNREGPSWTAGRLKRRPALLGPYLHFVEAAPGRPHLLARMLDRLHPSNPDTPPETIGSASSGLPVLANRHLMQPNIRSFTVGLVLLAVLLGFVIPLELPGTSKAASQTSLRLALVHRGKITTSNVPEGVTLPEGVSPEKIFGGERHPVSVRLVIDGLVLFEKTYEPSGLRKEGRMAALEQIFLEPGRPESGPKQVEIYMMDDDTGFRLVYADEIPFSAGLVPLLSYIELDDAFTRR